ncbi:MAG: chemotaxis response regulator protein-glutamate methylesterase [bacterium]
MSSEGLLKVLVVDDSAIMRQLLSDIFRSSQRIQVVGTAKDGREGLEKTRDLRPDVITLDVEMPVMNGLEALPGLVGIYQKPVVMVSSLTQEGAETTLQALELGAVDFVPKPGTNQVSRLKEEADEIIAKVLAAGRSQIRIAEATPRAARLPELATNTAPGQAITAVKSAATAITTPLHLVLIGISTGGPQALNDTLCFLEPPIPPVLIVQHMPGKFTSAFARRLNSKCHVEVREAATGDKLKNDQILIAPGGVHMRLVGKTPATARIELTDDPPMTGHKPSADYLFESAVRVFHSAITAIVMTGMGRDGARGAGLVRAAGGSTFGQDEATSTVYGMNKCAWLEGAIQTQFPLEKLPSIIRQAWSAPNRI